MGGEKVHPTARRVGSHETDVTHAGSNACQHLGNSWISHRQDLDPNSRAKCASNVEKNDPGRSSLQLTRSRILCVHDGVHPDPDLTGLHEVSDPRIRDLLCRGDAHPCRGERDRDKHLFHLHPHPRISARTAIRASDKLHRLKPVGEHTGVAFSARRAKHFRYSEFTPDVQPFAQKYSSFRNREVMI